MRANHQTKRIHNYLAAAMIHTFATVAVRIDQVSRNEKKTRRKMKEEKRKNASNETCGCIVASSTLASQ